MSKPFGSILKNAPPFTIATADGIEKRFTGSFFLRLGLALFGLPHLGLRMRYREVVRLISFKGNDIFLDAGCGIGTYCLSLANRFKRGQGVDLDKDKIKTAKVIAELSGFRNLDFAVADICRLPFSDNTFDKVLCSEVIEHIDDDLKAISELNRVLKKNGVLVLTTTSKINLNIQQKSSFRHARIGYSIQDLQSLFKHSNLNIRRIKPYGLFFGRLAWRLNRSCFKSNVLTALTFYPLSLLSMIDKFMPEKRDGSCIGYIIKLEKQ